jgi:hypothetical protein
MVAEGETEGDPAIELDLQSPSNIRAECSVIQYSKTTISGYGVASNRSTEKLSSDSTKRQSVHIVHQAALYISPHSPPLMFGPRPMI